MEHRAIGKGEVAIVHITGFGLVDSAAQVTPSQGEHSEYSQQRAQTEQAWSLRQALSTMCHGLACPCPPRRIRESHQRPGDGRDRYPHAPAQTWKALLSLWCQHITTWHTALSSSLALL